MELKEVGFDVGECWVGCFMCINGIKLVCMCKYKVIIDSYYCLGVVVNWLDGDFVVDVFNCKWVGDIIYVWILEGWFYFVVIFDFYSCWVVGWVVSDRMKKDLVIWVLDMVVCFCQFFEGCIFYFDCGS